MNGSLVSTVKFTQAMVLPCFTVKFLNFPPQLMNPANLIRLPLRVSTHQGITLTDFFKSPPFAEMSAYLLNKDQLHCSQIRIVYLDAEDLAIRYLYTEARVDSYKVDRPDSR